LLGRLTRQSAETRGEGGAAPQQVRILVLTAPVAEGHLSAARALEESLRRSSPEVEVTVCDALAVLPRSLRFLLCDAYRWQLRAAPWLFASLFNALCRSRALRWLSRSLVSRRGSRRLLRLVRRQRPDVVVSTWPAATMILGSLRLRGKIRVPVCATITDFAGLELWADPGVDLHLVMHEGLVRDVERVAGPGSAHAVSPLVSPRFRALSSAAVSRRRLGLPEDASIVLVSGGGWAIGDLEGAARAALEIGAFVVCLAGRDAETARRLRATFDSEPRVRVLAFTDHMSELLRAADVLVHSTGGVTCLEALTCGCPIVAYGAPPGHAPLSARVMDALGLASFVASRAELGNALLAAMQAPRIFLRERADAATLVLAAGPRVVVSLRTRLARSLSTACAVSVGLFVVCASDGTYSLVAEAHAVPERTSFVSSPDSVALVVRGSRRALLLFSREAQRGHVDASVAASDGLGPGDVAALRAAHLDPIPELRARGVSSWFEARGQLGRQAREYHLTGSFYYVAPKEGFTIVDYLLARHMGGRPVEPREDLLGRGGLGAVRAGDVAFATLGPGAGHHAGDLVVAIRGLQKRGLRVASVQQLAAGLSP
jgi:processive 1,2-diacylglycerol beta-glucosyltransferase